MARVLIRTNYYTFRNAIENSGPSMELSIFTAKVLPGSQFLYQGFLPPGAPGF